jgi:lysine-specific demethylase/histidyl-hydroxylase NO66
MAGPTVALASELGVESGTQGGAGDRPALRRCTSLEPDDFAARVWGREASLSRREQLPSGFEDLITLDELDRVVGRQGLRTPFLRVAKNGTTLPAARFTRGGGVGATIADQVGDDRLARLFADGATLVLQALHRTHGPLLDFARQLTTDLGHPVQVNAYVTPPQSQGFNDHYDVHDVFVLQVAGEKRWRIHAPVLAAPLRDQPWTDRRSAVEAAADTEPLLDVTLRPGDALYLPRGFLHAATALGDVSAHLTLGIHTWTRMHLLEQVTKLLGEVPALRESLPLGVDVTDPAALESVLAQTLDAVRANLGSVAAADVADRMAPAADAAARAEPVGPLAQTRALAALDLWTRLSWRRGLRARLSEAGDRLRIVTPEATAEVAAVLRPGIDRLLAGEDLAVAELGGSDDEAGPPDELRLEAARTLLREALVVVR